MLKFNLWKNSIKYGKKVYFMGLKYGTIYKALIIS